MQRRSEAVLPVNAAAPGAGEGSRVLVLTPTGRDAQSVREILEPLGLATHSVESMQALASGIDDSTGVVIVASEAARGSALKALVERLALQPSWSDLPIIQLAPPHKRLGLQMPPEAQQLFGRVTNMLVLERPLSRETLVSAVRASLKSRARQFRLREQIESLAAQSDALWASQAQLLLANHRRDFLFALAQRQRQSKSPQQIQQMAADALRERLGASRVGFCQLRSDADGSEMLVFGASSCAGELPVLAGELPLAEVGEGLLALLCGGGGTLRFDDAQNDARLRDSFLARAGVRGGLSATLRQDGRWVGCAYVHASAPRSWVDDEAELLEEVAQLTWDGFERASSEQALQESALQLARTQERDRLWQFSQDLLGIADANARWTSVNPAWSRLLGWPAAQIVGQALHAQVCARDRQRVAAACAQAAGQQKALQFECGMQTQEGGEKTIAWTVLPVDGLLYASGRDLTQQRAQEATLAATAEQLRQAQKMEALGQLTGGIAHDFNNMLQGILASLSVLGKKLATGRTDDAGRFIDSASQSAARAAALTHRLLAFSRRQPLAPQRVDANRLILSMADLLRQTVGESVQIVYALASELVPVACDVNQLESAVLNLALNARDAMPHGGTLTLSTRVARAARSAQPGAVEILVRDTGVGMPPDVLRQAFEPFFTTKPIGQGTGLGLSMIYGFAQQSNGQCSIESRVGEGTTVTLQLPVAPPEAVEDMPAPAPADVRSARGHILVVEDDTVVRGLVVEALSELGVTIAQASDGPAGLAQLKSDQAFDLLVTDVGLPGLNGRQLADAGRQLRPGLKVIFMTGYADTMTSADRSLPQGMALLTKPFAIDALIARVCEMLDGGTPAELPALSRSA